jgi:peroxiredoxin
VPCLAAAFPSGAASKTKAFLTKGDLMLKTGAKAPSFHLKSDEGKDIALEDFQGQRVFLFFFPKANTPG